MGRHCATLHSQSSFRHLGSGSVAGSYLNRFLVTFDLDIISDLEKSCNNSIRNSIYSLLEFSVLYFTCLIRRMGIITVAISSSVDCVSWFLRKEFVFLIVMCVCKVFLYNSSYSSYIFSSFKFPEYQLFSVNYFVGVHMYI